MKNFKPYYFTLDYDFLLGRLLIYLSKTFNKKYQYLLIAIENMYSKAFF